MFNLIKVPLDTTSKKKKRGLSSNFDSESNEVFAVFFSKVLLLSEIVLKCHRRKFNLFTPCFTSNHPVGHQCHNGRNFTRFHWIGVDVYFNFLIVVKSSLSTRQDTNISTNWVTKQSKNKENIKFQLNLMPLLKMMLLTSLKQEAIFSFGQLRRTT